uniref:Uncharacterized protein n=1 Tax=Glossina pallidipes TaxID=7398 RepID=A0A1A9ZS06_GLOPL
MQRKILCSASIVQCSVSSAQWSVSTLAADHLQFEKCAKEYLHTNIVNMFRPRLYFCEFKAASIDERVTEYDNVVFTLKSIIKTNIFALKTRTEALWRQVALNTHNKSLS